MAAPVSPASGDFITRGFWITEVTDRWTDVLDPWESYTPTWTAASGVTAVGSSGSITGSFAVLGSTVCVRIRLVIGSSASLGTGAWAFTLPVGYAPSANQTITGWVSNSAGTVRYPISAHLTAAGGVVAMGAITNLVGAAVPMAWAANDQLVLTGEYQWA